ncbi:hypothetical protein GF354_03445 [Candidatus Peregrinibacteria bacterium]|nr:hypothetical protein [Candidatus Peregrinibacteria bacterium]
MKKKFNNKGSALLVALLIMGVLISISLALSGLIFREVRVTKALLDSGKAYYAAESGVEEALYYLNTELPGWSTDRNIGKTSDSSAFEYEVKNACNSYPCFDSGEYEVRNVPYEVFYDVLNLNETLTIPLFTVKDGEIQSVTDFTVEFFPAFDPSTDLKIKNVSGWDILRWKIFGMTKIGDSYETESIGDFTAFSSGSAPNGENIFANVERPSWFGTVDCDDSGLERGSSIGGIKCPTYVLNISNSEDGKVCTNTQARDYWGYQEGEVRTIHDCYEIGKFLEDHSAGKNNSTGLNYLTLTNMMNPSVLDDQKFWSKAEREKASRLYFRIETYDKDTVREFAEIVSNGYSGSSKQSLSVQIRRGSFMPVFNFSLYSTYKDEEEGEGDDYWTGGEVEL